MLSPKYFLYWSIAPEGRISINISSNPKIDAYFLRRSGCREMYLLTPPQPIWIAEKLLARLNRYAPKNEASNLPKMAKRLLKEIYPQKHAAVAKQNINDWQLADIDVPDIKALFWGRALLGTEIPELIKANGYDLPWDPENWLQYLCLHSEVRREAAVGLDDLGIPYCRRCGESKGINEGDCLFCGSRHCFTCTNCQSMGWAKSCIPLYSQAYPDLTPIVSLVKPALDFGLTPPQARASLALEKFLDTGEKQFLVWAVCGSGKTEVSFGIVAKVLSSGGRVLYAIPRKDVVVELLPRFQKAFPGLEIAVLYGGSGERFRDQPLTIATTHQCLRFYRGFDLVILDEADAFPYEGSAMLHYAVDRAVKDKGRLVIMTATPSQNWIHKATAGSLPYVSIPARYHRQPLIIPELLKEHFYLDKRAGPDWAPPGLIADFILELKTNARRRMIFLPTIQLIEEWGKLLVKWAHARGVPGGIAHSKVGRREEIKLSLLKGEILFVVASTVFERGITLPDLDVLVMLADEEEIYDSRTLIQIAGRVGRLGEKGRVIFAGKNISKSMVEACRIIANMNREGYRLGYLDHE
ncbi:MAG: DEAD/DEAH box helicase family protein [Bacillota bacterium]